MEQATTIAGYRILGERYALQECLAVSAVGKVYRGLDLENVNACGADARIMVHMFSATALSLSPEEIYRQVSDACRRVAADWVMAPRSWGLEDDACYFVLDIPRQCHASGLTSGAVAQGAALGRQIERRLRPLARKGYLGKRTDPALLACSAKDGVYLLGTAFSPAIRALQKETGRTQESRNPAHIMSAGLGLLTAISAIASSYLIEPKHMVAPSVTAEVCPPPVSRTKIEYLAPVEPVMLPLAMTASLAIPDAAGSSLLLRDRVGLKSEEKVTTAAVESRKAAVAEEPPPRRAVERHPVRQRTQPSHPAPRPPPVAVVEKPQPVQTLGIADLVQLSNAAVAEGRFGDGRDGALHYIRLLREQARLHPQIKHVGNSVVSHYHELARTALKAGDIAQAQRYLVTALPLIQEFNLPHFNAAQAVLEQKAAQLQ
ncbi:hypothetical protein VSS37_08075 [Candidatus Thiothrix sp. Deng01]|uniref:Tetratricopeptide repeat protein n=1 Tax=Candidatus Thiothrix phosphatis TaxID=3112415 RepID=A0ABU6CVW7_9GAMM|nr:hypothetical protein [Candidatus Thiothrix sp. Deng01]MEB4590930.1 hypothetical protein [Candidatus Thiothrix sp. Deng01]